MAHLDRYHCNSISVRITEVIIYLFIIIILRARNLFFMKVLTSLSLCFAFCFQYTIRQREANHLTEKCCYFYLLLLDYYQSHLNINVFNELIYVILSDGSDVKEKKKLSCEIHV